MSVMNVDQTFKSLISHDYYSFERKNEHGVRVTYLQISLSLNSSHADIV